MGRGGRLFPCPGEGAGEGNDDPESDARRRRDDLGAGAGGLDRGGGRYLVEQGRDHAQYDTIRDAASVCDEEQDGNGVYAEYKQKSGTKLTFGDGNGSKIGCGHAKIPDVTSFRVCEDDAGDDSCSLWRLVR
ncbi:hypothetical protein SAMN04489729_8018 [Amycolatopsis lurida]|uniref:Uncharacterized protein n=1 Tax=Amycolatopsis lurida NRRL 2430 TaxID=1460371 RepID=A0A2P2FUE2_AMYLU|nr:hypothetical protein [Amycolatopsis lurida]KFU80319.1 hypothetical protein BB31_15965 [Amycolatopsis lurida NRRL 2430]SEE55023.1 hypothetical protein SAMN04489729_8018 [Amycolatopsis lurida]